MRRVFALAVLVIVGAACGSGSAAPSENVGVFMTRILREEINGQWSQQWSELHPAHQRLISRGQYVACSRGMGTNIARGKERFRVLDVVDQAIHVQGVPQKTAKLVTISFTEPGASPLTYRLHAVDLSGRWVWVLGDRFLVQVDRGRCLDGTPLVHPTS